MSPELVVRAAEVLAGIAIIVALFRVGMWLKKPGDRAQRLGAWWGVVAVAYAVARAVQLSTPEPDVAYTASAVQLVALFFIPIIVLDASGGVSWIKRSTAAVVCVGYLAFADDPTAAHHTEWKWRYGHAAE